MPSGQRKTDWVGPYQPYGVVNHVAQDYPGVVAIHKRRWLATSQHGLVNCMKTGDHPSHFDLLCAWFQKHNRTTRKTRIVVAIQQPDVTAEKRQGSSLHKRYGITIWTEDESASDPVREPEEKDLLAINRPV